MNFEETEVLYNVYRGILRNNRSFQPGKSTAVEYRMDCPEYADLLKKYPFEKIAGKGTDLQRAIRVLKYLSPKLTHSPWYDGHVGVPTQPGGFFFHHSGLLRAAYISAVSAPEHGS